MSDREKKIIERIKLISSLKKQIREADNDEDYDKVDKLQEKLNKIIGKKKEPEKEPEKVKVKKVKKEKKEKKQNEWTIFLKKWKSENPNISHRDALKQASIDYKLNKEGKNTFREKLLLKMIALKAKIKRYEKSKNQRNISDEKRQRYTDIYNNAMKEYNVILPKLKNVELKKNKYIDFELDNLIRKMNKKDKQSIHEIQKGKDIIRKIDEHIMGVPEVEKMKKKLILDDVEDTKLIIDTKNIIKSMDDKIKNIRPEIKKLIQKKEKIYKDIDKSNNKIKIINNSIKYYSGFLKK
jgi:hypothetical protein